MTPKQYRTRGEALSAAMEYIGSTRKRLVVEEITTPNGARRYCVFYPSDGFAITVQGNH